MRGIRGAITVNNNERSEILKHTKVLLNEIINKNSIKDNEIVSIIFTATNDLDKVYPAVAAREMGFKEIPLMCYQELRVKNSLPKCIRIMVYINRDCEPGQIKHIYLKKAKNLRPDLA